MLILFVLTIVISNALGYVRGVRHAEQFAQRLARDTSGITARAFRHYSVGTLLSGPSSRRCQGTIGALE